ncbi:hypothetical protein [Pseudoduganella namucuonensis]|uniref:Uncharacterized protein n=1 Tax=Pseudoduganella namucuonensis TaxID=1035707 RepID=A0A1I7M3Z5_9BURK|nr:hypothetical protein [Pseudoduganella namucuonensis]SFV16645.1 hypothetical protein SAMN05216552_105417 [Pseudoduganella namucuonensis]
MAINLEASEAQPGAAGRFDRRHAEARQGRWLSELEHALLASGLGRQRRAEGARAPTAETLTSPSRPVGQGAPVGQGESRPVAAARAGRVPAGSGPDGADSTAEAGSVDRLSPSTLDSALAPESARAAGGDAAGTAAGMAAVPTAGAAPNGPTARSGHAAPDAAGLVTAGAGPETAGQSQAAIADQDGHGATGMDDAAQPAAAGSAPFAAGMATAVPRAPIAGPAPAAAGLVALDGDAGQAPPARLAAAGAVTDADAGMAVKTTAVVSARTALSGAMPLSSAPEEAAAAADMPPPELDETEAPQRHAPESPEPAGEPIAKKLLHLYHGADGVQAWIRDAELNAAQVRSLAQALAGELNTSGQRLAALTVNGRKVDDAEHAGGGRGADDGAPAEAAGDAAAHNITLRGYI